MERLFWSTSHAPEPTVDGITLIKGDGSSQYSESGELVRRVLAGAEIHTIITSNRTYASLSFTLGIDGDADWESVLSHPDKGVLGPTAHR